jgi:hypothetical protein
VRDESSGPQPQNVMAKMLGSTKLRTIVMLSVLAIGVIAATPIFVLASSRFLMSPDQQQGELAAAKAQKPGAFFVMRGGAYSRQAKRLRLHCSPGLCSERRVQTRRANRLEV